MFAVHWRYIGLSVGLILIAFSIAYFFSPDRPNLVGNAGYEEQSINYRAGGASCELDAGEIFLGRERRGRAEACDQVREQHRLDANDLIQQRRAADAAEASARFAFQQTWIALWGITLGLFTLLAAGLAAFFAREAANANKAAVVEARAGASAAEQSVAETKRIGEAQVRAYLAISPAELEIHSNSFVDERNSDDRFPKPFTVILTLWNAGQSPAKECKMHMHYWYSYGYQRENGEFQQSLGRNYMVTGGRSFHFVSADDKIRIDQDISVRFSDIERICLDESYFEVGVNITMEYKDVFDIRRSEIFSFNYYKGSKDFSFSDAHVTQYDQILQMNSFVDVMWAEQNARNGA